MKIDLFSDPHLGTRRGAHTTRNSSAFLKDRLFHQVNDLLKADPETPKLCLGDLFDRSYNDEETLLQGYLVAKQCALVLAGNHDETNRAGGTTSLQALHHMMGAESVFTLQQGSLSKPVVTTIGEGIYCVPHHASQEVFDKALERAIAGAKGEGTLLLLHCNYDSPFDTSDSTLNLSPEMAERLLEHFQYVLIGHEHNPKWLHDGRLILIGNTHPTSFADISDKFWWRYDTETRELTKERIWSVEDGYLELNFGAEIPDLEGINFVDIVGTEPVSRGTDISDYVNAVWKAGTGELVAVRNRVEVLDHLGNTPGSAERPALINLSQRITDDLAGSDLLEIWNELKRAAEEH